MKESDIRNKEVLNEYLEMVNEDIKNYFSSEQFTKVKCPICGNNEEEFEFIKSGFTYVTCKKCGTLYVNPRPTQQQLDFFYSKSDSNKFWAEKFFMPFVEARREKIFIPRAKEIAEEFSQYHMGKIGDVGAGFGIFLEELGKMWTDASLVAIEPSVEMIEICKNKGLIVIPKMFEDVNEQEGDFDLLCAFELFEHLHNPKQFLFKANKLIKTGGHLIFTTLNGRGFDIQLLWEKHKNVNPPHHLNFINPQSARMLLEECGFKIVSITTPGKLDWNIVEEMIKDGNADIGRFWKTICESDEKTKKELQYWISNNQLSSHIRIVAQKMEMIEE